MLPYIDRRAIKLLRFAVCILFLFFCSQAIFSENAPMPRKRPKDVANYQCPSNSSQFDDELTDSYFLRNNATEPRVLVILDSVFSRHGKLIVQTLNALKINHKVEAMSKNLPLLTTSKYGRYSLIILENYYKYLNMQRWNRQLLDKYCRDYNVPIFSFISSKPQDHLERIRVKGSSLYLWQNQEISALWTSPSIIHKIAKIGARREIGTGKDWVLFEDNAGFEPLISAEANGEQKSLVIRDLGGEDGVQRILYGHNITDWNVKMCFIDSLWWVLGSTSTFSLDRFIQIDIDDVFVGASGTRMVESDVRSLLEAQEEFRKSVQNFHFMLGFSGSFFRNGDEDEDAGDELLVELSEQFMWFPHMWRHNHAHEHNFTYLEAIMTQNRIFAESMKLNVKYPYAIAPQHDGVFPVHEEMYEAWKEVWNVTVTATEEYPHFKPSSERMGFIYKNISVLPRQTCGLYTHTQFFDEYPEGFQKVTSSIEGGELFFTIVQNPLSIFMTHQQNYAHDRLALYTFRNLFRFVSCWTNLRLKWRDPVASAKAYFEKFPAERLPLWTNPCTDPRHRAILPNIMNCSTIVLPNFLILGPQKTGSSALVHFLKLHPNVSVNDPLQMTFEEPQFFGGANYREGFQWYKDLFYPAVTVLEKSATYFDNPLAARQAAALVPEATLGVILHDPTRRAYSWFQHILAHNDSAAIKAKSLETILDALDDVTRKEDPLIAAWRKIKQRCISGGRYTHHLDRWLEYFSLSQVILLDGERLRSNPVEVLTEVTKQLGLPPFDYSAYIRFSPSKGFFCKIEHEKTKCLGGGKGRKYEEMSDSLRAKLDKIFAVDNAALYKFLRKNRRQIPEWLEKSLNRKA